MKITETEFEKMQPLGNQVILKLSARKTESKGGIVLPENMKLSVWHSGTVLKIGPGKRNPVDGKRIPSQLKVGQKAVFRAFSDGWELFEADDGTKYMILPEDLIEFCMNEKDAPE